MLRFDNQQLLRTAQQHEQRSEWPQVEALCRQILAEGGGTPDHAEALHLLGNAVGKMGRPAEAVTHIESAIRLNPSQVAYCFNLGAWLGVLKQHSAAINCLERGLHLAPQHPIGRFNLGCSLQAQGRFDEAASAYRRVIELLPSHAGSKFNLGNVLALTGDAEQAIHFYRQALALKPNDAGWHSNLIYAMLFHPGYDDPKIREELRIWNERFAKPLANLIKPPANNRDPNRPLKIGYVSPYFKNHVVGLNMIPLFRNHDRNPFDIHCFATVAAPDDITAEFQRLAHQYHDISGLTDAQAADLIRSIGIDILIDLSVHLGGNRLQIFAVKPAPIQVTFAGYPGTTGLETIDYRLTDPYLDPPGASGAAYSEISIRLPNSFWCFDPSASPYATPPEVSPLPAENNGHVTFGCLNNFRKVNQPTLDLWGKVLSALPGSRMMLLTQPGSHNQWVTKVLAKYGIAADRIGFEPMRSRKDYLLLYQQIDVALDTLPYNGHSTSLDSFYMGVPVVTLVGKTVVGRAGLSQLMNLGMPELIATSDADFVQIATELAGDLPRLADMRRGLRQRMEVSPLMDAPHFARNIEAVYRQMWQAWCAGTRVP